ncbi:MAG: 3-oxoacyl-[acyl-carrier-protein] synthase III C-terminal domain-containing protein [Pseudomonadota bacterium]
MDETRSFSIAGSGTYLPRREVSASELDEMTGQADGTTAERFGVVKRHWAGQDETSSYMGAVAAQRALDEACWDPSSLDVIIGACGVMEQPIPGTSLLIQRRLGLGDSGITCFDVNATCLSFLQAFDRALAGFALGEWRRALVFSADIASAALDFSEPEASVLFGDGAAAFALEADGPHQRVAHSFCSYADASDACKLEVGGTRLRPSDDLEDFLNRAKFQMDGPEVFRATSRRFPGFLQELLSNAGTSVEELTLVVPHQASAAALEHLKRCLADGHRKTIDIFANIGNQIATSMPFALHHARMDKRLRPGEQTLLIGSSAGVSLGGSVIQW